VIVVNQALLKNSVAALTAFVVYNWQARSKHVLSHRNLVGYRIPIEDLYLYCRVYDRQQSHLYYGGQSYSDTICHPSPRSY
jgi:hypothetical protein